MKIDVELPVGFRVEGLMGEKRVDLFVRAELSGYAVCARVREGLTVVCRRGHEHCVIVVGDEGWLEGLRRDGFEILHVVDFEAGATFQGEQLQP